MNRKILALILALAAVAAAIALAVSMKGTTPGGSLPETTPGESKSDHGAVEDSIFDIEQTEPTQEPEETRQPGETRQETPDAPETVPMDPDQDAPGYTRPAQTEPAVTEPAQPTEPPETTAPTEPIVVPEGEIDYEAFLALTPAQQRVYMESFESMDAFFDWYNAAKAAYEEAHPPIDVGDGVIDMEDIIG